MSGDSKDTPPENPEPGFFTRLWQGWNRVAPRWVKPNEFPDLETWESVRMDPPRQPSQRALKEEFGSETAYEVTPSRFPGLHLMREKIGNALGIVFPYTLYVVESDEVGAAYHYQKIPNAAGEVIGTTDGDIYLTTAMMSALPPSEVEPILAHEYRHARHNEETLWARSKEWRECDADRASVHVAGKEAAKTALGKLDALRMDKVRAERDRKDRQYRQDGSSFDERVGQCRNEYKNSAFYDMLCDYPLKIAGILRTGEFPEDEHSSTAERIARMEHGLPCPGEPGYGPVPQEKLKEAEDFLKAIGEPQGGLPSRIPKIAPIRGKG